MAEERVDTIPSLESHHMFMLNKELDSVSCGDAIKFIIERNLTPTPKPKQMKMLINSPGGEVTSTFALIDTIKGSPIPIYTYGLGMIASCGLMVFIAGKKGRRYITKNTSILSHQYSSYSYGKEHELFAAVQEFNLTSTRILDHYKKCTGLSDKQVREYLLPPEDRWLSATEAVKYGIADEIVSFY